MAHVKAGNSQPLDSSDKNMKKQDNAGNSQPPDSLNKKNNGKPDVTNTNRDIKKSKYLLILSKNASSQWIVSVWSKSS